MIGFHEKKAIETVKKIIAIKKADPDARRIVPSTYSKDNKERRLGYILQRIKQGKECGCSKGHKYYSSLGEIAESQGVPDIFEKVDRKSRGINKLQLAADWIVANGRMPRGTIKDPIENAHFVTIQNFGYVKDGKLQGIWYPEYDTIMNKANLAFVFKRDFDGKPVSADVDDLLNFYKRMNRLPTQLSDSYEERRLYAKLIRYKQVLHGKTSMVWNPEIDEKIKRRKIKNIFLNLVKGK